MAGKLMQPHIEQAFFRLRDGGALVSSNECSVIEITNARSTNRFFVDDEGFGYVYRTPEWLESRESFYLKHHS